MNPTDSHAKVGVVDRDKPVRTALLRLIKSAGFDALSFPSARQFLNDPRTEAMDCVVADVHMPDLSGLEMLEELNRSARDLSVILISGHGDVPTAVRAMKAGAVDFLEKPVDGKVLLAAIATATERSRRLQTWRAVLEDIKERYGTLTPREREVFVLVTSGLPNKQVGVELNAAEKTIKVHRARVMAKMEAHSLADLVRMADRLGIHLPVGGNEPRIAPAFGPRLGANSVLSLSGSAAARRRARARLVTNRLRLHTASARLGRRPVLEVSPGDVHEAIATHADLSLEQPVVGVNLTVETQPAQEPSHTTPPPQPKIPRRGRKSYTDNDYARIICESTSVGCRHLVF